MFRQRTRALPWGTADGRTDGGREIRESLLQEEGGTKCAPQSSQASRGFWHQETEFITQRCAIWTLTLTPHVEGAWPLGPRHLPFSPRVLAPASAVIPPGSRPGNGAAGTARGANRNCLPWDAKGRGKGRGSKGARRREPKGGSDSHFPRKSFLGLTSLAQSLEFENTNKQENTPKHPPKPHF